jgi:hypothetical protein
MRIYNKDNIAVFKDYQHTSAITSVISVDQMLIIGDERGKITLLYDYLS